MKTVIFARHGESENSKFESFEGAKDKGTPLTLRGREQAQSLAKQVEGAGITKIIASDLTRSKETAEIVGKNLGLEVEIWKEVHEFRGDHFTGMPYTEICGVATEMTWKGLIENMAGKDGSESIEEFTHRAQTVLQRLSVLKEERVLLVTHGLFLGALLEVQKHGIRDDFLDHLDDFHIPNCEAYEVLV